MNPALALIVAVSCVAILLAIASREWDTGRRRKLIGGLVVCCCAAAAAIMFQNARETTSVADNGDTKDDANLVTNRPIEDPSNGYADPMLVEVATRMNTPPGTRRGTAR